MFTLLNEFDSSIVIRHKLLYSSLNFLVDLRITVGSISSVRLYTVKLHLSQ